MGDFSAIVTGTAQSRMNLLICRLALDTGGCSVNMTARTGEATIGADLQKFPPSSRDSMVGSGLSLSSSASRAEEAATLGGDPFALAIPWVSLFLC